MRVVAALVLAGTLAAIQILPTLELYRLSTRAAGATTHLRAIEQFAITPYRLLELLAAGDRSGRATLGLFSRRQVIAGLCSTRHSKESIRENAQTHEEQQRAKHGASHLVKLEGIHA